MKNIGWKLMALAMVAEGFAVCLAFEQYLETWKKVLGGLEVFLDWFEERPSFTQKLAVMEICCGVFLLCKMKER